MILIPILSPGVAPNSHTDWPTRLNQFTIPQNGPRAGIATHRGHLSFQAAGVLCFHFYHFVNLQYPKGQKWRRFKRNPNASTDNSLGGGPGFWPLLLTVFPPPSCSHITHHLLLLEWPWTSSCGWGSTGNKEGMTRERTVICEQR